MSAIITTVIANSNSHGLKARKSSMASPVGSNTTQPTTPFSQTFCGRQPAINQDGTTNTQSSTASVYQARCETVCTSFDRLLSSKTIPAIIARVSTQYEVAARPFKPDRRAHSTPPCHITASTSTCQPQAGKPKSAARNKANRMLAVMMRCLSIGLALVRFTGGQLLAGPPETALAF